MVFIPSIVAVCVIGLILSVRKTIINNKEKHISIGNNTLKEESASPLVVVTLQLLINDTEISITFDSKLTNETSLLKSCHISADHFDFAMKCCEKLTINPTRFCIWSIIDTIQYGWDIYLDKGQLQPLEVNFSAGMRSSCLMKRVSFDYGPAQPINEPFNSTVAGTTSSISADSSENYHLNFDRNNDINATAPLNMNNNTAASPKTYEIWLEINGVTYVFEYISGVDPAFAAETLAVHFCEQKGSLLLGLVPPQADSPVVNDSSDSLLSNTSSSSNESLIYPEETPGVDMKIIIERILSECVVPIGQALMEKIFALIDSQNYDSSFPLTNM